MTSIQVEIFGNKAIVPRQDLERLIELARKCEAVSVEFHEAEITTKDMMRMAEEGKAFAFWMDAGEDTYSLEDGKPV